MCQLAVHTTSTLCQLHRCYVNLSTGRHSPFQYQLATGMTTLCKLTPRMDNPERMRMGVILWATWAEWGMSTAASTSQLSTIRLTFRTKYVNMMYNIGSGAGTSDPAPQIQPNGEVLSGNIATPRQSEDKRIWLIKSPKLRLWELSQ